jgi:hypothetical protein
MLVADILINNASGNRVISFLDGNADIIRSLCLKRMLPKWSLYVPALLVYLSEFL